MLIGSAAFFTVYFKFPNLKYFSTAINVVRGKYDDHDKNDDKSKDGEVSHFQALATAVSTKGFCCMLLYISPETSDNCFGKGSSTDCILRKPIPDALPLAIVLSESLVILSPEPS